MSKIETGGPAFPCDHLVDEDGIGLSSGMTLRDYFAAKAMQVIRADTEFVLRHDPDSVADRAYEQADAMLKAREE